MRAAILAIFLMTVCQTLAQKVQFDPRDKNDVLDRLTQAQQSDLERADRIKAFFAAEGCSGNLLREQPVDGLRPNIICELPGRSQESVVVGAHYDRAATVGRPIDNWSGASLLPALYHSLRNRQRNHRFIFVAFADHEGDVSGADFFVGHMPAAELGHIEAMVNLDALGLSPTKVWSARSNKELVQDLLTMAYALKLPASQIDMERAGASDADAFIRQQIPNITIHSMTEDNLAAGASTPLQPDSYYDTYRLVCGYLAYLDVILKARPHSE
jgi:hypothetical protein